MPRIWVALDLEFTGLDPQRDEIIEIGMVRFSGDEVLETFSSPVNARRPIPFKVQQLSGITQAEVNGAPTLDSLKGRILAFIKAYPLVGHTIEMDLRFLTRQGLPLQNLSVDTFELASILLPEAHRYGLADLAAHLGIPVEQSHRALADAVTTKNLFVALQERVRGWDPGLLAEITDLSASSDWPPLRVFRDVLEERRAAESPGLLSGRPATPAVSFLAAPTPRDDDENARLEPRKDILLLDEDALAAWISPGGRVASAIAGYEHRAEQVEMLRAVTQAFNTPNHLLVEAGTGTGKSLAYLLPAAQFAAQNDRRVIVSSNTINLQDQLFNKDIPDLQRILPLPFRAAILKGRSNYLCMRRLAAFRRSRRLTPEQARVLAKVFAWLPTTRTGDRAELLLINTDNDVWADLQATPETCPGDGCPFRKTGRCFFYRARGRAERAHIIVVNHALLLSDLAMESRILPEYDYVIIDEAHHLEEQATSQFSFEAGRAEVYAFFNALSHQDAETPGGLVAQVPMLYSRNGVSDTARTALGTAIREVETDIDRAAPRLYDLFNVLARFLEQHNPNGRSGTRRLYDEDIRLTSGFRIQPDWTAVEIAWEGLSAGMNALLKDLQRLGDLVEGLGLDEDSERDALLQELRGQLQRGQEMRDGLDRILMDPSEEEIYWLSVGRNSEEITVHSAPLQVGPLLNERLFMEKSCVVLTSATLRTAGSFHFIEKRLNIEDPAELALDSPFDFKSSVLLYVPKDIPEPNQPNYQKTVQQALIDLCRATEGRALVLFTSNSQLRETYRAIQPALEDDEIVVLAQGVDGSRRQLLHNFRNTPRAVLLGTRSFWEGVDVVGEALICLVITRLPFSVPTDPIFSARAETFEDPFNEFYLPEAILRFRQGFGRLIRSREDYGVVVVLDKRILTKPYGKTILRSLPPCTARQGPLDSLASVAKRWLDPANRK
jgi:DNA polymerase-3 subunit epsilon/ATP-dependent DNA helicase DinG